MSAQARFFADFTQENEDVNQFPEKRFTLTTATKSASGVNVATTTKTTAGEPLISSITPSFQWQDIGFAFGFKQGYTSTTPQGSQVPLGVRFKSMSVTAGKEAPFGIAGTSVSCGVAQKQDEAKGVLTAKTWHFQPGFSFQNELAAFQAAGEYVLEEGVTQADFSLAVEHSHFGLGGLFSWKPDEKEPWAKVGAAYRQPDYSLQASLGLLEGDEEKKEDAKKKVDVDIFYQYCEDLSLAANLGGRLGKDSTLEKKSFSVASAYKINPDAAFKSKLGWTQKGDDHKLKTNLSLEQRLSSYCTLTASANLNASSLLGGSVDPADHTFGLQVDIE